MLSAEKSECCRRRQRPSPCSEARGCRSDVQMPPKFPSPYNAALIDVSMNGRKKGITDLLKGWPNPSLLPSAQIKAASANSLSDPSTFIPGLLYGPDDSYKLLRVQIAQ